MNKRDLRDIFEAAATWVTVAALVVGIGKPIGHALGPCGLEVNKDHPYCQIVRGETSTPRLTQK